MAQKTTAVKSEEVAYTSPSTAENQNVSEKAYARAPVSPAPSTAITLPVVKSASDFIMILRARCVTVQNRNMIVRALASPDMAFTIIATFETSPPAKFAKKRARIMKRGAPGGWPTSSLKEEAMNSPQSHRLVVGSIVIR